jgi:hypothetical protein
MKEVESYYNPEMKVLKTSESKDSKLIKVSYSKELQDFFRDEDIFPYLPTSVPKVKQSPHITFYKYKWQKNRSQSEVPIDIVRN